MMNPSEREALIVAHLPQVKHLARLQHRRCPQVELDDLIQAGSIGLIRAVDRFDPERSFLLKTLAEHKISGAMLDYLRQIDPLPREVRKFQKNRHAIVAELERNGSIIGDSSVAEHMGLPLNKYQTFCRMISATEQVSLHESAQALKLAG